MGRISVIMTTTGAYLVVVCLLFRAFGECINDDPTCLVNDDAMTSLLQMAPVKAEQQTLMKAEAGLPKENTKVQHDSAALDQDEAETHTGERATIKYDYHLLARQVPGSCFYDSSVKSTFEMNVNDPSHDCYMDLARLTMPGAKADGNSFRFMLRWQMVPDVYTITPSKTVDLVWTQTSSPKESRIEGFTPISHYAHPQTFRSQYHCGNFSGLGKSGNSECILDENGDGDCWNGCVGSTTVFEWHGRFLPGPEVSTFREAIQVELYLLVNPKQYSYHLLASQYHVGSFCTFDASTKDKFNNYHQDQSNCFMDLSPLDYIGAKQDGTSYRFMLWWYMPDTYEVSQVMWTQTSSLKESSIKGFKALSSDAFDATLSSGCSQFRGLGKSDSDACIIDGTGGEPCWWNCAGTIGVKDIRGPLEKLVQGFKLWLLMDPQPPMESPVGFHLSHTRLLARQVASQCYMADSVKVSFEMSTENPSASCYMDLGSLSQDGGWARRGGDGFHLMLQWTLENGTRLDFEWSQRSYPSSDTIEGFEAMNGIAVQASDPSSTTDCTRFRGLGKSASGQCVMDANGPDVCWFGCVGSITSYEGDFIPVYFGTPLKAKSFELYEQLHFKPYGGTQLLARQFSSICNMDPWTRWSFSMNALNSDASCYMNLEPLVEPGAKADDTSFYLELIWTLEDDSIMHVVWSQTSLPFRATIQGFKPISDDAIAAHAHTGDCAGFHGLGKSADGQCVVDGTGGDLCYWNCAGVVVGYQGNFMPGPSSKKAKGFELHLLKKEVRNVDMPGPVLLARQVANSCYMEPSAKSTFKTNELNQSAECFMNLDRLKSPVAKLDGVAFHFLLRWTLDDGSQYEIKWSQTSSPMEATIENFKPISVSALAANEYPGHCSGFHGLGKSADGQCVMDGTGGDLCYWNCAGSLVGFQGNFIPGPLERRATSFELFVLPGEFQ